MSEENTFENVQRRHSTVMAKYEWTSSLMNMKKSGNEIHDRRTKNHRKANEFLQALLQRRSDGSLLDDHGTLDRYRKFLRNKSNLNDDDDDVLNEFERRLRSLNKDRYQQWKRKPIHSMTIGLQTASESSNDIQSLNTTDRIKSLSKSTLTTNCSSEGTQTNLVFNSDEYPSSSLDRSSSSSTSNSTSKTIHRPKARRADGTEIVAISTRTRLRRASSDILIFHHCFFPRALKAREQIQTEKIFEEPVLHSIEQYDKTQVMHLLDQIETKCSPVDFTTMLDQLTLSTIQMDNPIFENAKSQVEEKENVLILPPNLFDPSSISEDYFNTVDVMIDDPKRISVYTMTIGIVQLSPTLLVPYSILNGRRPFLQCSNQTNFKRIYSKQAKQTCQVTAIESVINIESLQENDILLKINHQSVWDLTTDLVRDILEQSNHCLLTIARLCQPII